jgi:hypothetical protein
MKTPPSWFTLPCPVNIATLQSGKLTFRDKRGEKIIDFQADKKNIY